MDLLEFGLDANNLLCYFCGFMDLLEFGLDANYLVCYSLFVRSYFQFFILLLFASCSMFRS